MRREGASGDAEEPAAVVPDPVAFGVLLQQGDEEVQVFFEQ